MDILCTTSHDSWHTAEDVLQTLSTYTHLSGEKKKIIRNLSTEGSSDLHPRPKFSDPTSVAGRGTHHQNLLDRNYADKYASYDKQLRKVCGDGMSNELIEQHWGQAVLAQDVEGQFDPVENEDTAEKCYSSSSDISDSAHCSSLSVNSSHPSLDDNISFNKIYSPVEELPIEAEVKKLDINKLSFEDCNKLFVRPSVLPKHQTPRATAGNPDEGVKKLPPRANKCRNALLNNLLPNQEESSDPSLVLKPPGEFLTKVPDVTPGGPLGERRHHLASKKKHKKGAITYSLQDFHLNYNEFPPLS